MGSGDVYTAICPLTRTALGKATPARLVAREGDLVLELHNYRGPTKRFWEMRWPGAFFQGVPICAYYLEVADRSDYTTGAEMAQALAGGELSESLDIPYTFPAEGERRHTASYSRDGQTDRQSLGIELDLMGWRLLRRWDSRGEVGWPMLEAKEEFNAKTPRRREDSAPPESVQSASSTFYFAQQSNDGRVEAAGAAAKCTAPGLWLWGNAEAGRWVAGHFGEKAATLTLTTPEGSVTVVGMGAGLLVWEKGSVAVEAIGQPEVMMG